MSTEGVLAAAFLPTDGYIDPASVTQAIAKGARQAKRANLRAHEGHVDHCRRPARHDRSHRRRRHRSCEMVVNAAGMWGMEIGRMAGVRMPAVAVEHQYVLTGPIPAYTRPSCAHADDARPGSSSSTTSPTGPGCWSAGTSPTPCRSGSRASRCRSADSC